MPGCDDVETDQVMAIADRTTIADAAMILRLKCIVFPVGPPSATGRSASPMSGSLRVGQFKRCDGRHRMCAHRRPQYR